MRRFPLASLYTFFIVAENKSFTNAAKQLFITQGAVSKQVKQLEDHLNETLFDRHSNSIELTKAGKTLYKYAQIAFSNIRQGTEHIKNRARLSLVIRSAPTFATRWLAFHLHEFHYTYPFVDIVLIDSSIQRPVDCDIVYAKQTPSSTATLFMLEKNIAVCASYLFDPDIQKIFTDRQLLHILSEGKYPLDLWSQWQKQAKMAIDPEKGLYFSTQDQLINATVSGLGIAIVDQNMVQDLLKALWLLPVSDHVLTGPFGYWIEAKNDNEATLLFQDWLHHYNHGTPNRNGFFYYS